MTKRCIMSTLSRSLNNNNNNNVSRLCLICVFQLIVMLDAVCFAMTTDDWERFKVIFGKKYGNAGEETRRSSIRRLNMHLIRTHNEEASRKRHIYMLRENILTDMTPEEYRTLLGYKYSSVTQRTEGRRVRRQNNDYAYPPRMPVYKNTVDVSWLPTCVNWTERGWVGPVKNQGHCGSCWAFSATGSLQAQYYNHTRTRILLSEQNLIDCTRPQGNDGCDGGDMYNAFWYVNTVGIEAAATYPYTSSSGSGRTWPCNFNASRSVMKITSWRNLKTLSELALQQAVALVGPVAVGIDATPSTFMSYGRGVYRSSECQSSLYQLNHAVLVVGYGVYDDQPYWLIQNSWGTSWGINGYMMLARNENNMCGIATAASFPVIQQSSPMNGVSGNSRCPSTTQLQGPFNVAYNGTAVHFISQRLVLSLSIAISHLIIL